MGPSASLLQDGTAWPGHSIILLHLRVASAAASHPQGCRVSCTGPSCSAGNHLRPPCSWSQESALSGRHPWLLWQSFIASRAAAFRSITLDEGQLPADALLAVLDASWELQELDVAGSSGCCYSLASLRFRLMASVLGVWPGGSPLSGNTHCLYSSLQGQVPETGFM